VGGPCNHRTQTARRQRRILLAQTTGLEIDCSDTDYKPKGKAVNVIRLDVMGKGQHRGSHHNTTLRGLPTEDDFLLARTTVTQNSGLSVLSTVHK